jgi:selenide,water dikinase
VLAQVLRPIRELFKPEEHPRLLAGIADDAAVYEIDSETAVVQTLDFFPPVVDDPWTFGAIAAANAMSDVYAMGGEVVLALNIAGFPEDFPPEVMSEIFRGGWDKVAEGGGVVAGGHTVLDDEPKYGLSVMGTVHPKRILAKSGARPGDALVLSKALGTGVILTASKRDVVKPEHLDGAVRSMLLLNRHASHLAREAGATAVTDVSGFGIAGHALEIADKSGVRVVLRTGALPLLPGAIDHARAGIDFGGLERNRSQLAERLTISEGVAEEMRRLVFDPQTSGGLLIAVAEANASPLVERLQADGYAAARVGEVTPGADVLVQP